MDPSREVEPGFKMFLSSSPSPFSGATWFLISTSLDERVSFSYFLLLSGYLCLVVEGTWPRMVVASLTFTYFLSFLAHLHPTSFILFQLKF